MIEATDVADLKKEGDEEEEEDFGQEGSGLDLAPEAGPKR